MSAPENTKGVPSSKESAIMYENIVRTAKNGFWLVNAQGRFLDVNDAYCRMTGYSREELLGMSISGIEANESPEDVAEHIRATAEARHDRFETRHRRKDGAVIDIEVNANYLDSDGGKFFVFLTDITELKKNEAYLKVLSSAVEQSPTAVLITDPSGGIEYVNPQFSALTGYNASELIGNKPSVLKSGIHPSEFYGEIWKTITSGRPWRGDICNRKKNGELYWEMKSISPIKNASGEITHFVSVQIEDIERKKTEEKLRKSEERLAEAQRIAHIGNWEWDIRTNEVWWSDGLYQVFGVKPQGFGANFEAFIERVHPEDKWSVRKAVDDALHKKTPYKNQYRIMLPSGEVRIMHSRAEVSFDETGSPVRMMGTAQDITECKLMEAELSKAQKIEALGVLAGGIAHDFNNILTGIVGNVFLMKKASAGNDAAIGRLTLIDSAVTRAKGLTHKLLTFSSGGAPVKEAVDLAKVATETARLVFSGSRVTFAVDAEAGPWTVEADEGQIDQVFQNIYINALQAMPDGGRLGIRFENSDGAGEVPLQSGRFVKITIADNGPGIPNEHIPKIFDPFFTTRAGGSGLGLSICFSIVKRHSGFMKAGSGAYGGAAFYIYLPATQAAAARGPEAASTEQATPGSNRILVMDDEEMVRDTATAILTELGYEVLLATSGEAALELYREAIRTDKPIALVIMDLTVQSGMGGSEAIGKLLSIDPGARAIVSSGYCNSPVMSDYRKFGFKGVLQKPYDIAEFSAAVKKALQEP